MTDFYNELLKATDNLIDITFSRFGTITNIDNDLCTVKEEEQDIIHQNVPILNKVAAKVGDKVVLGFVDNSLYNPIVLGNLTRGNSGSVEVDSELSVTSTNPVQNKIIANALNDKANVSHNHNINDVVSLQITLDNKVNITDVRLSDNRNPLSNNLAPTSVNVIDLDNVRGTGFYYALGNSNIQYVSNLPIDWGDIGFYLVVEETNNATYCKQTITSYNGEKMFVRTRGDNGWTDWREIKLIAPVHIVYIFEDDGSIDKSSITFGDSINLRNGGTSTVTWNSEGYYIITQTGSQKESMMVLNDLTGTTDNFCLEYDSYCEQIGGSSGFVIYNNANSWVKLTDDCSSDKRLWYGYNTGSFTEIPLTGTETTYQKWLHYKFTIQGRDLKMEIYNGDNQIFTYSVTIPSAITISDTTQFGIDSEWQRNTKTRYKNLQAYKI